MERMSVCLVVLAVLCGAVLSQDNENFPDEWEAQDMPNPVRSPQHCHLQRPGFVCDPNRILSDREIELLEWLLEGFYINDTVCPCSQNTCDNGHKGSHLSVAIVRKLKLQGPSRDPEVAIMQSAGAFALDLQKTYWKSGECENNLVFVYSRDDGVIFTSYGKTVGKTLKPNVVEAIQGRFQYLFKHREDLLHGFIEVIIAYRETLNGDDKYNPQGPHYEQLVGGASFLQSSGLLATMTLAALTSRWLSQ